MADIKKTIEVIIGAVNKVSPGAREASADIEKLSQQATASGAALATFAAGGAAALFTIAKSAADAGDHLRDLSIQSGVAVEDLSTLKVVAEQNGTSIDSLAGGLKFLSRNAAEAASGSGNAADAFKRLGVDVKGADGSLKPVKQLLFEAADGLAGRAAGLALHQLDRVAVALDVDVGGGHAVVLEQAGVAELGRQVRDVVDCRREGFEGEVHEDGPFWCRVLVVLGCGSAQNDAGGGHVGVGGGLLAFGGDASTPDETRGPGLTVTHEADALGIACGGVSVGQQDGGGGLRAVGVVVVIGGVFAGGGDLADDGAGDQVLPGNDGDFFAADRAIGFGNDEFAGTEGFGEGHIRFPSE